MTKCPRREPAERTVKDECVVLPPIPHNALPALRTKRDPNEEERVRLYVESQARD